jgi:hypothetical protein
MKLTTNVIKIHIQVTDLLEVRVEVPALIIESLVHAQFLFQPPTFIVAACDSVDFGACCLSKLTRHSANGACCTRNDQCFATLKLSDLFEALIYIFVRVRMKSE